MKTAATRSQRRAPVRILRPKPEQDEFVDFKDVCELTGPARQLEELKMAFESVGYVIRKTEVFPHDFPYVVLRLDCSTAPFFSTGAELRGSRSRYDRVRAHPRTEGRPSGCKNWQSPSRGLPVGPARTREFGGQGNG
jgi:hypothetical protein